MTTLITAAEETRIKMTAQYFTHNSTNKENDEIFYSRLEVEKDARVCTTK